MDVYLATKDGYSLYRAEGLQFGPSDVKRLIESRVEFVYVSVRDHGTYYRTMEHSLQHIIAEPTLAREKKAEILYATSLELASQIMAAPPGAEEIARSTHVVRAAVQLILKDPEAFNRLFETFNHDFYTATHMVNVCSTALFVAQHMGLEDIDGIIHLGTGALLHDVGKIFIPNDILNRLDPLTAEQFAVIRSHVERGCEHLQRVAQLPPKVMALVAEHHERMDGSGYPKGLKGDRISPIGRLAGIADTFDAMTSVRPYRSRTYSIPEVLQHLEDQAPEKFDIEIVRAFTSLVEHNILRPAGIPRQPQAASPDGGAAESRYTQCYFRIPAVVRRIKSVKGRLGLGPEEKVVAHRMSCSGFGFLSPRPVPLDQNLLLSEPRLGDGLLERFFAVVVSCRDHGDGWFTVDAQFHRCLDPEYVNQLKAITSIREFSLLAET